MPPPHAPRPREPEPPPKPLVLLIAVVSLLFALVVGGCEDDGSTNPRPHSPMPTRSAARLDPEKTGGTAPPCAFTVLPNHVV
ncbi:hypothetical protein [Streptomyces odontomachi]|uniref:hypothetical protein n=1 Tax=Streptomyces odontomachi TaxID=2944940 RepID=UPI00210C3E17|nr:hypothetical protein [Streptomyces sp. ODS25]